MTEPTVFVKTKEKLTMGQKQMIMKRVEKRTGLKVLVFDNGLDGSVVGPPYIYEESLGKHSFKVGVQTIGELLEMVKKLQQIKVDDYDRTGVL